MESWNVYSQNTPSTPSSAWLCPNNATGSDWLHPQSNNNTDRERNENNAALATPTRFIMEYNDVNQNSSGSYYPYAQEMERLFENSFLKIGNPEDLLNNNLSSWLNTTESVVPVTTSASNIIADPVSATTCSNSPTPSLVTDDDQDQIYNKLQERRISTFIDDDQFPINTMPSSTVTENQENRQIVATSSSSSTRSTSPISPNKSQREQKVHYPMATSSSFYQPVLTTSDKQDLFTRQRLLTDGKDQYLLAKKHDLKQLLLPLTTTKESMDGTMTVATITSPSPSLSTDDDVDQLDQFQKENHQDFQLSDLPMQQPSPASSEYFSSNSKSPSSNETTPKQKKRRFSQRKIKRPTKANEEELISPTDEPLSEQELTNSATISGRASATVTSAISNSNESSSAANTASSGASTSTDFSESSTKRGVPDDGHDESPEEKRSRLLERNRIAAAKCRQKKKQAQESLQQQASDLTQRNTTMHSLVNDLREEALKLKNQLLAHSTCNCNVIQEYVRTSGQFAFARAPYSK